MIEKLYTVEEVAELASVTGRTIRNYLKSGQLKGRKIGGQWRFPESEVQRLLTGAPLEEEIEEAPAAIIEETPVQNSAAPIVNATPEPYTEAPLAQPQEPEPPKQVQPAAEPAEQPVVSSQAESAATAPATYPAEPATPQAPPESAATAPSSYPVQPTAPQAPPEGAPAVAPAYPAQPIPPAPQPVQGGYFQPLGTPSYYHPQGFAPQPYYEQPPVYYPAYPQQVPQPIYTPPVAPWPPSATPEGPLHPARQMYYQPAAAGQPQVVTSFTAEDIAATMQIDNPKAKIEPEEEVEEKEEREEREEESLYPELSDVGKRVAEFVSEVHDASDGPQTCSVIDLYQTFEVAQQISDKIAEIAAEETEHGTPCLSFVEYDARYYIARYTLFGSSSFLSRCLTLLG